MRKQLMVALLALTMSTMAATMAFAEFVYVTKNGKKYHKESSRFIAGKDGVEKLTREEAEELGYEPSRAFLRAEAKEQAADMEKTSAAKKK